MPGIVVKVLKPTIIISLIWFLFAMNFANIAFFGQILTASNIGRHMLFNSLKIANIGGHWIDHLCPRYRLQNTTKYRKLMWQTPDEETIFFTQTSCGLLFKSRQACAVESASHHHANRRILVFLTTPEIDASQPLVKILLKLHNVHFAWLDLDKLLLKSPLHSWHEERQWIINEEHANVFVSDAVRSIMLQKYGGTYLDMDMLTLRPFPNVTNYLGRLDFEQVNGAIMSFTKDHPFMRTVVESMPKVYVPFEPGSIGPDLFLSILKQLCPENFATKFVFSRLTDAHNAEETDAYLTDVKPYLEKPQMCTDVSIFPEKIFYPIHFAHYTKERYLLFKTGHAYGEKFLSATGAYTLHLYNSLTHIHPIAVGGDSILEAVMKRNCPKVYQYLKENVKIL